ncbi:putative zinc protease YmxG [Geobacter sp. OR-1]|uniref:M16 family metallopeptidase n=1 Tax=Geobacter sp. OR-1 TaxID=1266765 RepID=UPI000543E65E|nr:pitrilysin family protein [Geobacter sp. OR-1]GAM09055.1 putative zinc protease YmxG [Geobacter sp. OR-1]
MITCKTATLTNGLRLVAVEMPHLHSAEIAVYVKAGGRNDTAEKAGIAHFLEHMLFRGTTEYPTTLELETAFEAIGGSVNAATDEETTCFFSRVHPQHVAKGVAMLASMLRRPLLSGLETEKRIIIEEALEDINEQGEEINTHNIASRLMWPGHPLGMPTIGYLESIRAISVEDLSAYMARHYLPANAVAVVAGNVNGADFFRACESAFGDWVNGGLPPQMPAVHSQTEPQVHFVSDSDSQLHLQLAFRGFSRFDHRIMHLRLLRRILCGGGSSRLHISLREQLGIVYSVDASIAAYEETGAFSIELSTSPENLEKAVEEVLAEVVALGFGTIPLEEFERVRNSYFFDLEYSRDSTYEMQVRFGWGELMGIVRSIEDDYAEAAALSAADLKAAAEALFAPENLNLIVVGPWQDIHRNAIEFQITRFCRAWAAKQVIR